MGFILRGVVVQWLRKRVFESGDHIVTKPLSWHLHLWNVAINTISEGCLV